MLHLPMLTCSLLLNSHSVLGNRHQNYMSASPAFGLALSVSRISSVSTAKARGLYCADVVELKLSAERLVFTLIG